MELAGLMSMSESEPELTHLRLLPTGHYTHHSMEGHNTAAIGEVH
jgi:hypothetical protein